MSKNILIGILVLIIVTGGWVLLGQKQENKMSSTPIPTVDLDTSTANSEVQPSTTLDEKATWKTYNGERFTFKYHDSWNLNTYDGTVYLESPKKAKDNQVFHIDINFEKTTQTPQEWLKGKTVGGMCCAEEFELKEIEINSQRFYKVVPKQAKYPGIVTSHNGNIYYITSASGYFDGGIYYYDDNDPVLKENLQIFNQVISSFKFL